MGRTQAFTCGHLRHGIWTGNGTRRQRIFAMTKPVPVSAMPDRRGEGSMAAASCLAPGDSAGTALPGQHSASPPSCDEARVRRLNPTWAIFRQADCAYTARRDAWGNQQIICVPTLEELEARLLALQRDPVV